MSLIILDIMLLKAKRQYTEFSLRMYHVFVPNEQNTRSTDAHYVLLQNLQLIRNYNIRRKS